MGHIITKEEAVEVLTAGLNRWEDYISPGDTLQSCPEELMDKCWDIDMYFKMSKIKGPLGEYAGIGTTWAKKKYNGKPTIHIYNHERNNKYYDIRDTVLHELAHHIAWVVYKDRGHGPRWAWVCQILGANPSARAKALPQS